MKILDRYSSAVHARSLKSDPRTTWSDTDVLGAAGLAAKVNPLGIALARMLSGGGDSDVISEMANKVRVRSHSIKSRVTEVQARDIAMAVIAWYRYGACQPCGGTGYKIIPGTPSLGDECPRCFGAGKMPFDRQFSDKYITLAKWIAGEIEKSQAEAGDLAMRLLMPRMDL